ncbi:hypothetical protein GNQ08_21325 [Paenibacillus macerans]|uniref:Uncharacterized protein n=2 Tax=Paenibacillus macerans TaxID=44252 RepID=A0A6N8EYH9_PAEMA|nr:hypothetical protein [Paenibacillus macerans]MUG24909.1 hypothetical protein [Paenibacillus macerans]
MIVKLSSGAVIYNRKTFYTCKINVFDKTITPNEWWAVLADIAKALNLKAKLIKERLDDEAVSNGHISDSLGRVQVVNDEKNTVR